MSTITAVADAALTEPSLWPMTATFAYDTDEPLEVRMTLSLHDDVFYRGEPLNRAITWTFARELIDAAFCNLGTSFGHGDVRVELMDNYLVFGLVGTAGVRHAVIVEVGPVHDFMIKSFVLVPASREHLTEADLDGTIARLLGEAS